jgi:hypothetical protein
MPAGYHKDARNKKSHTASCMALKKWVKQIGENGNSGC